MLAAFTSFGAFKDYVKNLYSKIQGSDEPQNASDILVFRATVRGAQLNSQNPPVSNSIYGVAIPQRSKVQVLKEFGTEEQLMELFPTLPSEVVDKVWEQQGHSWNSCLGILNSLLLSKEVVILDNVESLFKNENWPTLLEAAQIPQKEPTANGLSVEDWVLLQMESFISNPESLPATMPSSMTHQKKESNSSTSSSSTMLKDKSNISHNSPSAMNMINSGGKPSATSSSSGPTPYKDMLMHSSKHDAGTHETHDHHNHDKENLRSRAMPPSSSAAISHRTPHTHND